MHPFGPNEAYAPEANYAQYSFDPARFQENSYVWNLYQQGLVLRGTPPTSHVTVTSVDLQAKPYPAVTLTDCATVNGSWLPYYRDSGKPVPTVQPSGASAPPPYGQTVKVIYYKNHWGVQNADVDVSKTCSA